MCHVTLYGCDMSHVTLSVSHMTLWEMWHVSCDTVCMWHVTCAMQYSHVTQRQHRSPYDHSRLSLVSLARYSTATIMDSIWWHILCYSSNHVTSYHIKSHSSNRFHITSYSSSHSYNECDILSYRTHHHTIIPLVIRTSSHSSSHSSDGHHITSYHIHIIDIISHCRSYYSSGTGLYDSFQTATNGIAK